jgi:hypothetical protein
MRKASPSLATALVAALALCALAAFTTRVASAQTASDARAALSRFPDSQAVLYVNANRLVNVAMPRVMPRAEYQKMVDEAKKVGLDVRGLEYAAVGVRFAQGAAADAPPEFVALVRGGFNADALLALARVGLGGQEAKFREEAYGSKTLLIFDTARAMKSGEAASACADAQAGVPAPKPNPYPEVAAVSLDANTLVVGVPSYVKAAVDAASGGAGLKAATLDLAARDPLALWSLTADLPENLPQLLQKTGMPANEELNRIVGWLKSFSFSMGMDALNFTTKAAVTADTPEHAATLDGMLTMGLNVAEGALRGEAAKPGNKDAAKARTALAVLQGLTHAVEGSTLEVGVSVPQATVADFIRKEMAKGKKPAKARRSTATRRGRARRR